MERGIGKNLQYRAVKLPELDHFPLNFYDVNLAKFFAAARDGEKKLFVKKNYELIN